MPVVYAIVTYFVAYPILQDYIESTQNAAGTAVILGVVVGFISAGIRACR